MWFQQKMINIYNESNLHKTLKLFYSDKFNGKTEVPYQKWICDIITESNSIIEIQTSNLQALKEKALSAINDKINFTIIHKCTAGTHRHQYQRPVPDRIPHYSGFRRKTF